MIQGSIHLKIDNGFERIMREGDVNSLPELHFHKVIIKYNFSMYMYTYTNRKEFKKRKNIFEIQTKSKLEKIIYNCKKR